jgi:flagellar motor switch protein FliN
MQTAEDIRHFEDVPLLLEARVPCESLAIGSLMALAPGMIVHTSRAAGESVDVSVSDQSVASAELIVIENRLAVRLSDFSEKK